MPLVFNGVLIPENVANALTVDGVDIHDVYFNGVQVWHQVLAKLSNGWSGDSLAKDTIVLKGIDTSGALWRYQNTATSWGAWITVDLISGSIGSNSSLYGTSGINNVTASSFMAIVSGSQLAGTIYYDANSKNFSGAIGGTSFGYDTSGGLLRYRHDTSGAWISLT